MSIDQDKSDIVELLKKQGPMDVEDIRIRLGFASEARAKSALFLLKEERTIECAASSVSVYRIVGDERPVPTINLHAQYRRGRKARGRS